jgi:hypothetical protein
LISVSSRRCPSIRVTGSMVILPSAGGGSVGVVVGAVPDDVPPAALPLPRRPTVPPACLRAR